MPLPVIVENLENVNPEHRALYVEHEPGKFRLDADLDSYVESQIPALKDALRKEREDNKAFKKLGRAPSEVAALIADADEMSAKIGSIDTIIRQTQETFALKHADLESQLAAATASERGIIRDVLLRRGLEKAGITDEGMMLLVDRLGERIRLDTVDGKRTLTILSADGVTPMQVKGKAAATFDDLAAEARKEFPGQFVGTNAGGGGAPPRGQRTPSPKVLTRAEFNDLHPYERAQRMAEGWSLVD